MELREGDAPLRHWDGRMNSGEDKLRASLARVHERRDLDAADTRAHQEVIESTVHEVATAIYAFLTSMRKAGNPGLERPPGARWGRRSWEGWIFEDGSVSSHGPKYRDSPEAWALEMLSRRPRDGWGPHPLRETTSQAKTIIGRLATIMDKHGATIDSGNGADDRPERAR